MPATWRDLHYLQRPAKNIERKMIADALLRLDRVRNLEDWRYVGLGSVYFADFALFHRTVGFTSMVNIECVDTTDNRERFLFNRPFGCVDLEWGLAADVLPTIGWHQPTVVWLDYDGKLDANMLADVGAVISNCSTPTVVIASANVESLGAPNSKILELFSEAVTPGRVPAGTVEGDVAGWGLAAVAYEVVAAEIAAAVTDRNGVLGEDEHVHWQQILHFQYADGAKMLTVGGLVHPSAKTKEVADAGLDSLFFARVGAEAFRISVPKITNREILHMAGQMPCEDAALHHHGIPQRERLQYAQAYRYFPAYVDVDL